MKGIILAGGTGSRLFPLTKVTNKHLLTVGRHLMIEHIIAKMKQCEIEDIMVITGNEHIGSIMNLLGSGYNYGVSFTYRVQDEPQGIVHALSLCKDFVGSDKCLVILGDNIFKDNIKKYVDDFCKQDKGAKIFLKEVADPERFGVVELRDGKIIGIKEKPCCPKSNYCVTGIYLFDGRVFDVIQALKLSDCGKIEITDVNNWYMKHNSLTYNFLEGWWVDAGTFSSFAYANEMTQNLELDYILSKNYKRG